MPTEAIDCYMREMQTALASTPRGAILETVRHLYRAWEARQQIFVLGNGGSASTASHVGNDLSKATIVPGMPRMKVMALTDNVALMTAWANDAAYDTIFQEQLANLLEPGDVVIGISASGNSPNVLRAMSYANDHGAVTIGWTGLSGGALRNLVDCCVHAPTDDVGMVECVHLVIDHIVTNAIRDAIAASRTGAAVQQDVAVPAIRG